jgi:magnesium chelatase family protein
MTVAHVHTVAFVGIDARDVDVQVQMSPTSLPSFTIVGLGDKAVAESRERVRAALMAIGLALPPERIIVNLAPADLPKEGSHYDLPVAVGLLIAMGVIPAEVMAEYSAVGELALDGAIARVPGVLNAGIAAAARGRGLICPEACGPEAAWAGDLRVLAPRTLLQLINHFKGTQVLTSPEAIPPGPEAIRGDLRDIKGQESAKRALEVAAAGGHHMAMIGPPGSGKSMLAARLPGILPPLEAAEALEVSMIASISGALPEGIISRRRPFRDPHHSASMAALVGGGTKAKPGEVSLAHNGVLFLDELPEYSRQVLDSLRQPLETGETVVARANAHVRYPCRVQLIAAMNPCRCGHLADPMQACSRAPKCAEDYMAKISGPMLDRIDLFIDVPTVSAADLTLPPASEGSAEVAARVAAARDIQTRRYAGFATKGEASVVRTNATADGEVLEAVASPDEAGRALLTEAIERMRLTARGYHRVLRVARTLADLGAEENIGRLHIAEALSYRRAPNYR